MHFVPLQYDGPFFFMALADFSSVKKKCLFSGGHLFWLPVASLIQSNCYFECDAFLTAPVWWTMNFMTSTEFYLFFHVEVFGFERWYFFVFCHARLLNCFFFWLWCVSYRSSMMDLNFHGISFFLAPSRSVCFLEGICSGCLLPSWVNQIVVLSMMQFLPLQYDGPWFFWHQLSSSFSFTLKILGLEGGIFLLSSLQGRPIVFSSDCDAFRTALVWWTLFFMASHDFRSVKKKCLFSGGHLFWLTVASLIQSNCYFECDAILTAPVWWTMIFMTSTEFYLFFHVEDFGFERWYFFAFCHARLLNRFFFWLWCVSYRSSMMDLDFHGLSWF